MAVEARRTWWRLEPGVEYNDDYRYYKGDEVVEGGKTGLCYHCARSTYWYSVLWNGAAFCSPDCYDWWDFQVWVDLTPWCEGAD